MKNLLLIGDSIRMGYDRSVKRTLEGKVNVFFPQENCRFASYVLRYFHEYLKETKAEEIEAYNQAAVEVVKKYGFEVNDLYALSVTLPESAHSDSVHYYTPEGTERITKQVLSFVAPALGLSEIPPYKEDLYWEDPIGI